MDVAAARFPDECGPTYFELTTVMALLSFAAGGVQAAVLEVGLGGRLDSTNVCDPLVTVITSISFDHTRQLGNTLGAIAFEKAGIVKPGVPLVSGVTEDEPREVIERVCHERGSRLIQLGHDFNYRYHPPLQVDDRPGQGRVDFSFPAAPPPGSSYQDLPLGLLGPHQAANAAVALATLIQLQQLGWSISEAHLRRGLANVHSPARGSRRPTTDGNHRRGAQRGICSGTAGNAGNQLRPAAPRVDLRHDAGQRRAGMMAQLLPKFDVVLLTRYGNNPRRRAHRRAAGDRERAGGRTLPDICRCGQRLGRGCACCVTPEHLICVTGSFFTAAEIGAQMALRPLAWPEPAVRPA